MGRWVGRGQSGRWSGLAAGAGGVALALGCLAVDAAWAERKIRAGRPDPRVRHVVYSENDIVRLVGHYGYQTVIQFGGGEKIQTVALGDSVGWQAVNLRRGNLLLLKPVEAEASTNMTVVTDARIYSFELAADETGRARQRDHTYRLIFHYGEDAVQTSFSGAVPGDGAVRGLASWSTGAAGGVGGAVSSPAASWNFGYEFAGDRQLVPVHVFDDGVHTYFEFARSRSTPAIFVADAEGEESLVNLHVRGRYVVVQRLASQFTLRDGPIETCIFRVDPTAEVELDMNSPRPEGETGELQGEREELGAAAEDAEAGAGEES